MTKYTDLVDEFLKASVTAQKNRRRRTWSIVATGTLLVVVLLGIIWQLSHQPWQPVFADDVVTTIIHSNRDNRDYYYFGTLNVGMGRIAADLTVDIVREGLPIGPPAQGIAGKDVRSIELLAVDQQNPETVLAYLFEDNSAFQGIYRSTDGGQSWQDSGLPLPEGYILEMAVWGDQVLAAVSTNEGYGLFSAKFSRPNWQLRLGCGQLPLPDASSVVIIPGDQAIYVAGRGGVFRTEISGPWQWEQMVDLPIVDRLFVSSDQSGRPLFFTTPATPIGTYPIYRWIAGKTPELIATVDDYPVSLAPHPQPDATTPLFVLFGDGEVLAIDRNGHSRSLGRKDGRSFVLQAGLHPVTGRTWLLLAHEDGLLEYRDRLD